MNGRIDRGATRWRAAAVAALVAAVLGCDSSPSDAFVSWEPSPDAYEPDDTRETASRIAPGEVQTRSLYPAGDADWVWYPSSEGKAVYVSTDAWTKGVWILRIGEFATCYPLVHRMPNLASTRDTVRIGVEAWEGCVDETENEGRAIPTGDPVDIGIYTIRLEPR